MYHSISDKIKRGVHPYYETSTSPHVFAEHMKFLYENNYKVLNLCDVENYLKNDINQKTVVITFDDGFRDFYTDAFPILKTYDFSATVFLATAFIGEERKKFLGKECLSWGEVKELSEYGVEFGSHSLTHPKIYDLSWAEVHKELKESKTQIEEKLQKSITSFSYPYAYPQEDRKFVNLFILELLNNGYHECVTTIIGRVGLDSLMLRMKRLPVNMFDDKKLFKAKLQGAYDWLEVFQKMSRLIRRL